MKLRIKLQKFQEIAGAQLLAGWLILCLGGAAQAIAQSILIDFGNDFSFRGVDTPSPDQNGNHWNSVWSGVFHPNLVDVNGNATLIGLAFDSAAGTDSYNGPAGAVSLPTFTPAELAATDIDAIALGDLGVINAAFDHYISSEFQIQGLDPAKTYDLTFFGSKKYEGDATTVYSVHTDNSYSAQVDAVNLNVRNPTHPALHNRDTMATIHDLSPQADNALYVRFIGAAGGAGYLNAMKVAVNSGTNIPPVATGGSFSVPEGERLVIEASAVASDSNGDAVWFMSIGETDAVDYGSVTLTDGGATLTYTNTFGAPGSIDLFSYVVSDGLGGLATNRLSIRIEPINGLSLVSATGDGAFACLSYVAIPGRSYGLDRASSLTPPIDWDEQQLQVSDTNGVLRFTNALALPPANTFFRVRIANTEADRGANLPYLTYQAEAGASGGGAILHGPSMEEVDAESEASGRQYVELNQTGGFVEWTVRKPARGMVLRFTLPDAPNGGGISASLGLYVNGSRVASLALTSKFAWQYFPLSGTMEASNDPTVHPRPRMRFDDVRHLFPAVLDPGDVLRLQKDAQDVSPTYGIDLIELEPIPAAVAAPPNSIDVSQPPYNAVPDDSGDDSAAFNSCLADARNQGRIMFIPSGRYELNQSFKVNAVEVQGAGMWHSELHFTNPGNCGLFGQGGNVKVRDLYLTTETTSRSGSHGIGGYFGQNSTLSNLWSEHFHTGAWIADYSGANQVTDGLIVSGCRLRNTYADGLNFAKGTKNCIVENTHFRNNGDDAMASWPSDAGLVPETSHNTFRFNTVENTWRAAGLGIFGGRSHLAHDCLFRDISGQAGIRFNTVFPGHPFSTSGEMVVSNMTLVRITGMDLWGNKFGAVAFETLNTPLHNIRLSNLDILDSKHHGVFYGSGNYEQINNIILNGAQIRNSGQYGIFVRNGSVGWSDNLFVVVTHSGTASVYDLAPFELRKITGNVGW